MEARHFFFFFFWESGLHSIDNESALLIGHKNAGHIDQAKGNHSSDGRTRLRDCANPHQRLATLVAEDRRDRQLDVADEAHQQHPRKDLLASKAYQSVKLGRKHPP